MIPHETPLLSLCIRFFFSFSQRLFCSEKKVFLFFLKRLRFCNHLFPPPSFFLSWKGSSMGIISSLLSKCLDDSFGVFSFTRGLYLILSDISFFFSFSLLTAPLRSYFLASFPSILFFPHFSRFGFFFVCVCVCKPTRVPVLKTRSEAVRLSLERERETNDTTASRRYHVVARTSQEMRKVYDHPHITRIVRSPPSVSPFSLPKREREERERERERERDGHKMTLRKTWPARG